MLGQLEYKVYTKEVLKQSPGVWGKPVNIFIKSDMLPFNNTVLFQVNNYEQGCFQKLYVYKYVIGIIFVLVAAAFLINFLKIEFCSNHYFLLVSF